MLLFSLMLVNKILVAMAMLHFDKFSKSPDALHEAKGLKIFLKMSFEFWILIGQKGSVFSVPAALSLTNVT